MRKKAAVPVAASNYLMNRLFVTFERLNIGEHRWMLDSFWFFQDVRRGSCRVLLRKNCGNSWRICPKFPEREIANWDLQL